MKPIPDCSAARVDCCPRVKAFAVAGSISGDYLEGIRAELERALKGSDTFAQFAVNLRPLLPKA